MTEMRLVEINGRWPLLLPEHRAARPEWPYWEATRLAAMRHHIAASDVVFDIGAEEGDFPALWASWGADVVLVEPNPRVWPNIRAIWRANNLEARLRGTFVGFAASQSTAVELRTGADWPDCADGEVIGDHGFLNLAERSGNQCVTIDELAVVFGPPSVITMDVEGAEVEVLHGALHTLRSHRPKVFVSVHPDFMRDMYGREPIELYDLMDSFDYRRTFLATDHETHEMFLPR